MKPTIIIGNLDKTFEIKGPSYLTMVEKCYTSPIITVEGIEIPKLEDQLAENEMKRHSLNDKAMSALVCALILVNSIGFAIVE